MYKLFIVLILVGCNAVDPIIGPTSSTLPTTPSDIPGDTAITQPTAPPAPINVPFAAPKNALWSENGPIGFSFVRDIWGDAFEDTTAFRYGWKSQKFVVNSGECFGGDCYRQPVYERKEYGESHHGFAVEGDEFWYSWSFYVPHESSKNSWVFYGQFIQPPAPNSNVGYDSIWMLLKRAGLPFCMIFDWVNRPSAFQHCESPNIRLISDSEFAGKWHDILIHIKWSHHADKGLTEVWVNNQLKGVYNGYTLTPGHLGVAVKYGIYRIANSKPSIAYYDEMRKGKTRQEVDIQMLISP